MKKFCVTQAAVWLKKAECLSILERDEEAASAYSMVVALAPNHIEARFTLSTLYQRLGYYEKALSVLEGEWYCICMIFYRLNDLFIDTRDSSMASVHTCD